MRKNPHMMSMRKGDEVESSTKHSRKTIDVLMTN